MTRVIELFQLREDSREIWLDASDASPVCNRRGAQRIANRERWPVIARVKGTGEFLYRVNPEEMPESAG